jgi:hypothetical protein
MLEIKPNIGLSEIKFGASKNAIMTLLGPPKDTEFLKEENVNNVEIWHYPDLGFSLFFELIQLPQLGSIEVYHEDAVLFGEKIFNLNEDELIELLRKNNYFEIETENHEWGERRISSDELNMDFYFQDGELVTVNFGINIEFNDNLGFSLN